MGLVLRVEETTDGVFGDIGLMNCELTDNAGPYRVSTARKVPPKVKEELDHLLEGIIEEVPEPNEWSASMVRLLQLFRITRDLRCQKRFSIFGFTATSIKPLP